MLAGAAAGLALLALLLLALAAAFLAVPERFPTGELARRAARELGAEWKPSWNELDLAVRSLSLRDKELALSARELCFDSPRASGCLESLDLAVRVRLSRSGVRVTRVLRLDVKGRRVRADVSPAPRAPAEPAADEGAPGLALLPPGTPFDGASIVLPFLEVVRGSAAARGAVSIGYDPVRARPFELTASLRSAGARAEIRASAAGLAGPQPVVRVRAAARTATARVTLDAGGAREAGEWRLRGDAALEASSGPVRELSLSSFTLTASPAGEARLESAIVLSPAAEGAWTASGLELPGRLGGRLRLTARRAPRPREEDRFEAEAALALEPVAGWYEIRGDLDARASGRLSRLKDLAIEQRSTLSLKIADFEDLVVFLADTPFAIPAPFESLKGPAALRVTSRGDPRRDVQSLDGRLTADLKGLGRQRLKLRLDAKAAGRRLALPDRRLDGSADLVIEEASLQAPHLDPLKLPRASVDPRIVTRRDKAKAAKAAAKRRAPRIAFSTGSVSFALTARTAAPATIHTDLAKSPVPVAIDLRASRPGAGASGTVELRNFVVEFFRREATVERLRFALSAGSKALDLDGLVLYRAAEAVIRVRLLGSTEKPRVELDSDPPMSQDDIVAMLLFGKSPNELDADESSTLAYTRSALADKAFGLASLYLFASTPIQYVGYDPSARSYTMRFKMPGGQTLQVDSGLDATRKVQLRKRLSRNFAFQAQARSHPEEGGGLTTFLEWFVRY